tara:strand:+ start:2767 stop:5121 length:2355 start_codon:yes stop_codon:yes gene_type:complete
MNPTTIENKPKTYTRPILLTKNNRPYIPKKEYVEPVVFVPINIQYLFDNNLNSSPSGYDLTSNGSITYETTPKSVYLDGSSYLSSNISIDVKTLGFWFKINTPTIDNYLISTTNDVFNIKISNTKLNIIIDTIEQPISYNFLSNKWYHLLLNYSNEKYEIYINSNLVQETVDYTALNNNTLYLGKSLESYSYSLITLDQNDSLYRYHEMVAIDSNLYLFGDLHTDSDLYNKLYKIDLSANTMEQISIQDPDDASNQIKSRHFISMISLDNSIFICGGINDNQYLDNFISIDTTTNYFEIKSFNGTEENKPSERTGHSFVVLPKGLQDYNPELYIFGGRYDTTYYNDLYRFNGGGISFKITLTSNVPTERAYHSMVADGDYLYIFGGRKDTYTYYNDFYKIEINYSTEYNSEKKEFDTITKRMNHKMAIIGNNIFILGGRNNDGILNDMHIIDKNTLELLYSFDSLLPENLSDYSMSVSNNDIYIYGGLSNIYDQYGQFIDYVVQSNLYKITNTTTNINGNIADLRLYNYSITDISSIYDEFFDNLPPTPTDFTTITFDNKTIGSTDMLSSVPNGTTELNIINNSILYNSNYEEGSGLYIDFTKTNLQNVIKVTITNFGTIYGRGGIGETIHKREGKYAITVLNNFDNINREITIINNGNIYGGGNGGYFYIEYGVSYPFILRNNGLSFNGTSYAIININAEGGDAQYYNGTDVIDAGTSYILSGATILDNRPPLVDTSSITYEYVDSSYVDKPLNNGGQDFDETKIIDLPSNSLVTQTYINNNQ